MESREQGEVGDSEAQCDAADERLWGFATSQYASPAVASACLRAQDELGMDVNLVLFAAWRASEKQALDVAMLAAAAMACRAWRDSVILPLRAQRREWKRCAPGDFEYAAIKRLELEAEKAQLAMLAARFSTAGSESDAGFALLLRRNLRALCRHYDVAGDALDDLQAALMTG